MSLPEDYARLASELKKLAKLLEVWTIKLKKLIGMLAVAILRFPASQLVGADPGARAAHVIIFHTCHFTRCEIDY
jgi:hypothetical protein